MFHIISKESKFQAPSNGVYSDLWHTSQLSQL